MSSKSLALIVSSICFSLVMFNMSIVAIAFPSISKSIISHMFSEQWIINSYILSVVCFGLIVGKLSDAINPIKLIYTGLALFALGSFVCLLTSSFSFFIFGRVLQGISTGLLFTPNIKLLADFYTTEKFGNVIGKAFGFGAFGLILSSLLGGALVQYLGWRSLFLLDIFVCLIAIVFLRKTQYSLSDFKKLNYSEVTSLSFVTLSLSFLVFIIMEGHSFGWFSKVILSCFLASFIFFLIFVYLELRIIPATVISTLFKNKVFIYANLLTLFIETIYISMIFLILYMQKSLGFTPSVTGWLIFPLYVLILFSNFFSALWIDTKGPFMPIVISTIIISLGFLSTSILLSNLNYLSVLPIILSVGFGVYIINNSLRTLVVQNSNIDNKGLSIGILETNKSISATFSFAILGSIITFYKINDKTNYFYLGFHEIVIVCTALSFICLIICFLLRKCQSSNSHRHG